MWYVRGGTGSIPIIIGRQMPHTTQSIRFTGCGNNSVNLLRYSLITSDGFIYYSIVFARKKKWWDRGPWSISLNKTGFSEAVYHFVSQGGIFWDGEIPPTTGHNTPTVWHVTTRHENYDKRICGAKKWLHGVQYLIPIWPDTMNKRTLSE